MKKYKLEYTERAYSYWKSFPDIPLRKIALLHSISYYTLTKFISEQLKKHAA